MTTHGAPSYDDAAGPLVRPFFLAGGRSRPACADLEIITLVVAAGRPVREVLSPEHADLLRICGQPLSVAEVSAMVRLPLVVVKVMLGDLIERGYLIHRTPPRTAAAATPELLEEILDGIRRL